MNRWFLIGLSVVFSFVPIATHAQEEAPAPAPVAEVTAPAAPQAPTPQERIAAIEAKRPVIEQSIADLRASDPIVNASTESIETQEAQRQIQLYETLNLTFGQQITALQRQIQLQNHLEQIRQRIEEASSPSVLLERIEQAKEEPVGFLQLEQKRVELRQKEQQKPNIEQQVESAQRAIEQARSTRQERVTSKQVIHDTINNTNDETDRAIASLRIPAADLAIRSASATVRLREFEATNMGITKEIFDLELKELQDTVQFMEQNVQFTREELDEQIDQLDNRALLLAQELDNARSQLSRAQSRQEVLQAQWSQSNTELNRAELDAQERLVDVESQRESNLTRLQQLINERKLVWKKRFDVFNGNVERRVIQNWRQEAMASIEALESDRDATQLTLTSLQTSQANLRSQVENLPEDQARLKQIRELELQHMQAFQDRLLTRIGDTNLTIGLYQELINEISAGETDLPFSEQVAIFMEQDVIYENTAGMLSKAIGIAAGLFIFLYFIRWLLARFLKRYLKDSEDVFRYELANTVHRTKFFFILSISLYIGSLFVNMPEGLRLNLNQIIILLLLIQGGIWVSYLAAASINRYLTIRSRQDAATLGALSIFNFISQTIIWSITLLAVLANYKVDITAFVTGLGIGGVAIALALQRILGDLFSSLSIVLDKPFVAGDFIIFEGTNFLGTVEKIGIKTTRIRSITGEQIICPNSSLLETPIRNFKRMYERRVVTVIGVVYSTTYEQLEQIPVMIREIAESVENIRFDRVHFKSFGAYSLDFEYVYYVLTSDYTAYMDVQQQINLALFRKFEEEGIEFAFPTQTHHIQTEKPKLPTPDARMITQEEKPPNIESDPESSSSDSFG